MGKVDRIHGMEQGSSKHIVRRRPGRSRRTTSTPSDEMHRQQEGLVAMEVRRIIMANRMWSVGCVSCCETRMAAGTAGAWTKSGDWTDHHSTGAGRWYT